MREYAQVMAIDVEALDALQAQALADEIINLSIHPSSDLSSQQRSVLQTKLLQVQTQAAENPYVEPEPPPEKTREEQWVEMVERFQSLGPDKGKFLEDQIRAFDEDTDDLRKNPNAANDKRDALLADSQKRLDDIKEDNRVADKT
jgi:hypothetical protein